MGGVSLWVVPHGYNVLMNSYKMDHIPHVTILNNLGYPRPTDDVGKEYEITVQGDLQSLYGTETVGVYCDVNVSHTISAPYMVLWYYGKRDVRSMPRLGPTMKGIMCLADCTSPNPTDWKIII
jgi:hypothetical protein